VAIGAPYCSIDMIEGSDLLSQRLAALPIQQVAKLHNTSVKMIERHYDRLGRRREGGSRVLGAAE
jgi:hypothetical protein